MKEYHEYDPGALPIYPPPIPGEAISLAIEGLPPYKDEHASIRNPKHGIYCRFVSLRELAVAEMAGRAPYHGPVGIAFEVHAPQLEKGRGLSDYNGGIADALGGRHGYTFTYLPIVYEHFDAHEI
jgi:hypothetical protein